jgi:lysophospholipase L1-like esterase
MSPIRILAVAIGLGLMAAQPVGAGSPAPSPSTVRYYLSLGDSLSVGFQPTGPEADDHRTDQGYPDQLVVLARDAIPGLELVKLGCPGESTSSMIEPNPRCPQPNGSQLDEALAFIEAHPGAVAFITIDIGFADFPNDDIASLTPGIEAIEQNLPQILYALEQAAPGIPLVGMTIYDPFLPAWLTGDEGLAELSVLIVHSINRALMGVFAASGASVADVEGAFDTADFTTIVPLEGVGDVPLNVARVCTWTWLCEAPPLGPDRHPNELGHAVIAAAFWQQLAPLLAAGPGA